MRDKLILLTLIAALFAGSFAAQRRLDRPGDNPLPLPDRCERIVSTAPSITETLFALGLGDRVVGVSRFCDYPPEARRRPQVGGFIDPNLEAVVLLRPDLVILLVECEQAAAAFHQLGLPTLMVCHQNVDGILQSFPTIGRACGAEAAAQRLLDDVHRRMEPIRRQTAGLARPRVMVVAGRAFGAGKLEEVIIAGNDGHLDRLVELAGGKNVYRGGPVRFPTVSPEGILTLNPEVIIDMVADDVLACQGESAILRDWQQAAETDAVRNGRVHVVADDRAARPGPGFVALLERFARLIHPEIEWKP